MAAYMAPEQMEGRDLTDKIDVWAFGVVLWELLSEQVRFEAIFTVCGQSTAARIGHFLANKCKLLVRDVLFLVCNNLLLSVP